MLLCIQHCIKCVFFYPSQDAADTESSSGEKSVLYLLLKMFASSSSSHLKASTRKLVLKVSNTSFCSAPTTLVYVRRVIFLYVSERDNRSESLIEDKHTSQIYVWDTQEETVGCNSG